MKRLTLAILLTLSFGTAQAHLRWGVRYQGYGPYKIWGNPQAGYVASYAGGARVGANTTNLPAFASNLGYHVNVATKAATARNFRIGKIYLLTGAGK